MELLTIIPIVNPHYIVWITCITFFECLTGWWFGTFIMFPNSWDDDPIRRTHIFQGGWNHQPDMIFHKFIGFKSKMSQIRQIFHGTLLLLKPQSEDLRHFFTGKLELSSSLLPLPCASRLATRICNEDRGGLGGRTTRNDSWLPE